MCIAGQNDHAAGRICLQLVGIELIAEADVENTRNNCVDSILRMFVWHELYPRGHFDSDYVGAGLCWVADNDGKARRRWESRERLPVDIFRKDRSEIGFTWLVGLVTHVLAPHLLKSGSTGSWGPSTHWGPQ